MSLSMGVPGTRKRCADTIVSQAVNNATWKYASGLIALLPAAVMAAISRGEKLAPRTLECRRLGLPPK